MKRKSIYLLFFVLLAFIILPIYSEAVKIVSWNALNFPGSTGVAREAYFRMVINKLNPDVLVVQEMLSQTGVNQFLSKVMNYTYPGTYAAAGFRVASRFRPERAVERRTVFSVSFLMLDSFHA